MSQPKDPEKARLWSERQSASGKKRAERDAKIAEASGKKPFAHLSKAIAKRWEDPTARSRQSEVQKIAQSTPENKEFRKKLLKDRWDDPDERAKLLASRKNIHNPTSNNKRGIGIKKAWEDPDYRERNIESRKITYSDPDWKLRKGEVLRRRYEDPELLEKMRKIMVKRYEDPLEREKVTERLLGGFWYGNVRYPERTFYCERWTRDFRNRCRAWDGYKSVLSGITKEQNLVKGKPVELSVHHVYYQKKACCEWDEDINGYYVMINLGTRIKPNMVRYDIKGDPNKFVTLSHAENVMVNYDKLKWIKIFEDIIEARGGKCYYTKEEMKHLDQIT